MKENKYHAKRTTCAQNHRHPSMSESQRCDCWHLRKRAGEILHIDVWPTVSLSCGQYKPDFGIWKLGEYGKERWQILMFYEDVKGVVTGEFRRIRKCFDAEHPAKPLHVVKRKGKGWEEI